MWIDRKKVPNVRSRICPDAVTVALITTVMCLSAGPGIAGELAAGDASAHRLVELRLTILADGSVGVDYSLNHVTRSLRLSLPRGRSESVRLEPADALMDAEGVVVLPNVARNFRMVILPDRAAQRWVRQYPLAFSVEGRGTAIYLPYLLPERGDEMRVFVQGGPGVAAVADGVYLRVEDDYQIIDPSGFVLLGRNLCPESTLQFAEDTPAWLDQAIRESYLNAQSEVTDLLGAAREDVPLLVDFSVEGAGAGPQIGGDAPGHGCVIRLWFRGEAWQSHGDDLRARMNDVLVHELVHCYQQPERWQIWAHEGHARFVQFFLGARRQGGGYSPGNRIEQRFNRDFDGCMSDLRVGKRTIDAYACGSVAYWLRWLQTGRVNMLARVDADQPTEARTIAGRFLKRTATETDVVDFLRSVGVAVQVAVGKREASNSVRSRLIHTLLRQHCGEIRGGYWTHETFLKLHAPGCPELDGFELRSIARRNVIENVHRGYAAVASSCRTEGRVLAVGVDGEEKWMNCDRSYAWPSTTGSRYQLVAPFADR